MYWFLLQLSKIVLLLILPFILLIRGAVYFHVHYHFFPWLSILGGVLLTALVLFIYFTFIYGRIFGDVGDVRSFKRRGLLAILIVLLYCLHGIFYVSSNNMKNTALQREITQVHPILRLSVSTIIHLDKKLVITDANRLPEDYQKMGLRSKKHSLHYKQKNGYTHALDLRTSQRSEFRNFLVKVYFQLMGFNALRHGGTGDHLHVSLLSHDRPYAK